MHLYLQIFSTMTCGLAVGFVSGALGIGGGILLVPFFFWLGTSEGWGLETSTHLAIATSLAAITLTSASAAYTHHKQKLLETNICLRTLPFAVLGIYGARLLHQFLPARTLLILLALLLSYVGVHLARNAPSAPALNETPPPLIPLSKNRLRWGCAVAGFSGGFLGALLGVGGGVILVPMFLFLLRMGFRRAIANSIGVIFLISFTATLWNLFSSLPEDPTGASPADMLGSIRATWVAVLVPFSIVSAYVGARLVPRLPLHLLQRGVALIIIVVAVTLWSRAFG